MRLGQDLVGKPIISIDEGRYLGTVKDLYLNYDITAIRGIFLGKEGLIKRKSLLITRDDIVVFGVDAILVRNSDAVTDNKTHSDADTWLLREQLNGREVDTPGGTRVAKVGDIILSDQLAILGISLSKVFVTGPLAESKMVLHEAITDVGNEDDKLTIDLAKAERSSTPSLDDEKTDTTPDDTWQPDFPPPNRDE